MYHEIKFGFQIAARKWAARDAVRSACSLAAKQPPEGSIFLGAFAPRTLPRLGHGSPFAIHKSRVKGHGTLIVTPRLGFPATPTKQSRGRISNRYKMRLLWLPWRLAVFSSRFPGATRNRQEPPPPNLFGRRGG